MRSNSYRLSITLLNISYDSGLCIVVPIIVLDTAQGPAMFAHDIAHGHRTQTCTVRPAMFAHKAKILDQKIKENPWDLELEICSILRIYVIQNR